MAKLVQQMTGTSKRILEILEVLELVWQARPANLEQVSTARVRATKDIAARRGVEERTILDKYARQLNLTAEQFDDLVERWLRHNDYALRSRLEAHTASRSPDPDLSAIQAFFKQHPTPRL